MISIRIRYEGSCTVVVMIYYPNCVDWKKIILEIRVLDPDWIRIRIGFGSGLDSDPDWIRIRIESGLDPDSAILWILIRILILILDPDPGARKLRKSSGKCTYFYT
jgi:hypothetical protein